MSPRRRAIISGKYKRVRCTTAWQFTCTMSSNRCFSMEGNSPYWPKPALLISRSISIPFSLAKEKIISGAFESAKSAGNSSLLIL